MYNKVPYSQQVPVYFRKIFRISVRESAWKNVLFSFIIGLIIGAVCSKPINIQGVFITVSGCIWLGIFNTIQVICKEHDIINSEFRQGMNLGAFVTAHILFQAVLCFVQALLIYLVSAIFGLFEGLDGGDTVMIFIFFCLLTFCSSILGLMVSAIAGNPTTAMTIMPFLLIVQLLLGDWPINLDGFSETFTYFTFSRWGMNAVGAFSNDHIHDKGDAMNTVGALMICLVLAAVFAVVTYIALRARNKDS